MNALSQVRPRIFISLCTIVPLGFLIKFYSGSGHEWFNYYGAGALYEIAWILFFFLIFPHKGAINVITIWVFIITCVLEVLQLWHPLILEQIRASFLGSTLIGTTFSWLDFPHYVLGCALGWLWIRQIGKSCF